MHIVWDYKNGTFAYRLFFFFLFALLLKPEKGLMIISLFKHASYYKISLFIHTYIVYTIYYCIIIIIITYIVHAPPPASRPSA